MAILTELEVEATQTATSSHLSTSRSRRRSSPGAPTHSPNINRNLSELFDRCVMISHQGSLTNGSKQPDKPHEMAISEGHRGQIDPNAAGTLNSQPSGYVPENMAEKPGQEASQNSQSKPSNGFSPGLETGQKTDRSTTDMDIESLGDGFTTVGSKKSSKSVGPTHVKTRQYLFGVHISRTCAVDSRINSVDLANMFRLIGNLDSNAIILPATRDSTIARKATSIAKSTGMNFVDFLDIQTTNWGRPSEQTKRTTLSFWIASDKISGVAKLRDNNNFKAFLISGKCSMAPTHLHESRSKVVAYLEGKDPKHTHRETLRERIGDHIYSHLPADIPINIVTARENGIQLLAIATGSKDAAPLEEFLNTHPLDGLGLIFHSWKRKQKTEFAQRIAGHQMLVMNSKAFKITSMDPEVFDQFSDIMRQCRDSKDVIVDVCQTGHSKTTGVVYVQYLQGHEREVLLDIEASLQEVPNPEDSTFGRARITNGEKPDDPTVQSQNTTASKSEGDPLPQSKWQTQFAKWSQQSNLKQPTQASIPAAITTTPKSFSEALMANLSQPDRAESPSEDADSTLTPRTSNNGSWTSRRSTRMDELEKENAELKHTIQELQATMEARLATMMDERLATMEQRFQKLLEDQQEEPNRKRPDTKPSPAAKVPTEAIRQATGMPMGLPSGGFPRPPSAKPASHMFRSQGKHSPAMGSPPT